MKIGKSVNGPKPKLSDNLYHLIGVHTYYGVYCDTNNDEAYYNVCYCGHCAKFGSLNGFVRYTDRYERKWCRL